LGGDVTFLALLGIRLGGGGKEKGEMRRAKKELDPNDQGLAEGCRTMSKRTRRHTLSLGA